jgi:alkaline phosphatase D
MTVFYGAMLYGRVSFAVIADRQFKSGPFHVSNWKGRADHLKDPDYDVSKLDQPGLELLGKRQEKFLNEWASDWFGANFKCVLSQTIFCNLANYHGPNQQFIYGDLDANGWPQAGRNRALEAMRKGFAFHYAGDQHLPSIVHNGVDEFGDAGWSFCVPSIAAGYPRAWRPDTEGRPVQNRVNGPNTGDYLDGFGNKMTVWAVGNPEKKNRPGRVPTAHDKSSGYGIVRFNHADRTITMECWRLDFDAEKLKAGDQFPGWPKTIKFTDNYGRKAAAYLPTIYVTGLKDPVIQVIDEANDQLVYALRIQGSSFRPKVFHEGKYTVKVGDPDNGLLKTVSEVSSLPTGASGEFEVRFP